MNPKLLEFYAGAMAMSLAAPMGIPPTKVDISIETIRQEQSERKSAYNKILLKKGLQEFKYNIFGNTYFVTAINQKNAERKYLQILKSLKC